MGSTALQETCNKQSYESLHNYYTDYESRYGSIDSAPNAPFSISELLLKLKQNIADSRKKNVEILQLSAEVSGQVCV